VTDDWRSVSADPPTEDDIGPAELMLLGKEVPGTFTPGLIFIKDGRHVQWQDYEFWRPTIG
jgi:hypothetical protein